MKKQLSQAALAAKQIRVILKKEFPGQKFSVTSENYSMGDSVRVNWIDGPKTDDVSPLIKHFQYGTFDGMTDSYENTNSRPDIPQTKWVQVGRSISDETSAKIQQEMGISDASAYNNNAQCWNNQLIYRRAYEKSYYVAP